MKINQALLHVLLMFSAFLLSQSTLAQVFEIKNASKHYAVKITTECSQSACDGQAKIDLHPKNKTRKVQRFSSDDLSMDLDENFKPSVNVVQLYGEQSAVIFADFNFDGSEDMAIRNGNYGAYGGPTYDVYVFHQTKNKFVLSQELSTLTHENLGMFQIDPQRKRIITFNKSGCCYHIRSEYGVIPKQGLRLVKEFIEDATAVEGKVKVVERTLNRGRWQEQTRYYALDEYYKNEKGL